MYVKLSSLKHSAHWPFIRSTIQCKMNVILDAAAAAFTLMYSQISGEGRKKDFQKICRIKLSVKYFFMVVS